MVPKINISPSICVAFALLHLIASITANNEIIFPDDMEEDFLTKHSREIKQRFAIHFNIGVETLAKRTLSEVDKANREKNIIISPLSIQTCLAMARMGASGSTASEIDRAFALIPQQPKEFSNKFHSILAEYANSSILTIANKFYISQGYEVKDTFSDVLRNQFFSSAENVNFGDRNKAAHTINTWVESKTDNLVKDLISAQSLSSDTRLVLVNVIHFEREWQDQFEESFTEKQDFYRDETNTVKLPMMYKFGEFAYGEFPELDAKALELPYRDIDLSLFILLPNSRTGLAALQKKFEAIHLADLCQNMSIQGVRIDIPKFKAELEVELSDTLKEMGMESMFSWNADFSGMVNSADQLQVSKIIHKAYIEVNEKGTKAAAATGMDFPDRMGSNKEFKADKSFLYVLKNSKNVIIFSGNYKGLE